jgi:hypothetical protein
MGETGRSMKVGVKVGEMYPPKWAPKESKDGRRSLGLVRRFQEKLRTRPAAVLAKAFLYLLLLY